MYDEWASWRLTEMERKAHKGGRVKTFPAGDRPIPFSADTFKVEPEMAMYPYPVEARQIPCGPHGWKWEVKIEEIGILCYSENREDAFKAAMERYDQWLKR